jgi:hypothetical protein
LYERLQGPQREEILAMLKQELRKSSQDDNEGENAP